ncbi:flavin reductase family protein [Musicola keenii]|uniref:flavin reductase family protein n=1 Tax=Musicola keenii TaxID=2884250 RepID=UPI0017844390|nr:flavin reductase family protein [Musicola keenii]
MQDLPLGKAFTLLESGPVILVTTNDGQRNNVMTITWTMVLGFSASFAITTGPWNYSYAALQTSRECVISIPTADMIDTVVGIGMCSGQDTDKFHQFNLTPLPGRQVRAPLIGECRANIECRVVDIIEHYNIIVLAGLAAYFDEARMEKKMLHAVGDGTFIVDGVRLDRKAMMRAKLPDGV